MTTEQREMKQVIFDLKQRDFSLREVAKRVGISENTLKSRIYSGTAKQIHIDEIRRAFPELKKQLMTASEEPKSEYVLYLEQELERQKKIADELRAALIQGFTAKSKNP